LARDRPSVMEGRRAFDGAVLKSIVGQRASSCRSCPPSSAPTVPGEPSSSLSFAKMDSRSSKVTGVPSTVETMPSTGQFCIANSTSASATSRSSSVKFGDKARHLAAFEPRLPMGSNPRRETLELIISPCPAVNGHVVFHPLSSRGAKGVQLTTDDFGTPVAIFGVTGWAARLRGPQALSVESGASPPMNPVAPRAGMETTDPKFPERATYSPRARPSGCPPPLAIQ